MEFEISEYLNTRDCISKDYLSKGYSAVKFHIRVPLADGLDPVAHCVSVSTLAKPILTIRTKKDNPYLIRPIILDSGRACF